MGRGVHVGRLALPGVDSGQLVFHEGPSASKPKLEEAAKTLIGTSFHGQSVNRFFRAGKKAEDNPYANTNYDRDKDVDDLYVTATSGWFNIR